MNVGIRSYEPEDFSDVVTLLNRSLKADQITSEVFQAKVLLDQNFDAKGAPVAVMGNKIVGFALGVVRKYALEDGPPDFDRSWITLIAVESETRRRGIGTKLVRWLEEYFRACDCKSIWVSPYAPNYFTPGVDIQAYPEALALFLSMGFEEVMRPLAMESNLDELTLPEWVEQKKNALTGSVTVEPFRPELILPVMDWMRTEFPGDWQRLARESMMKIAFGQYKSDNVWIAREGKRVVGYCQHDDTGRFGPLGVSKDERGRGIGALLLFNCLKAMQSKGLRKAWLMWTDDKVAKLYSHAGFQERRRFAVFRKWL